MSPASLPVTNCSVNWAVPFLSDFQSGTHWQTIFHFKVCDETVSLNFLFSFWLSLWADFFQEALWITSIPCRDAKSSKKAASQRVWAPLPCSSVEVFNPWPISHSGAVGYIAGSKDIPSLLSQDMRGHLITVWKRFHEVKKRRLPLLQPLVLVNLFSPW